MKFGFWLINRMSEYELAWNQFNELCLPFTPPKIEFETKHSIWRKDKIRENWPPSRDESGRCHSIFYQKSISSKKSNTFNIFGQISVVFNTNWLFLMSRITSMKSFHWKLHTWESQVETSKSTNMNWYRQEKTVRRSENFKRRGI